MPLALAHANELYRAMKADPDLKPKTGDSSRSESLDLKLIFLLMKIIVCSRAQVECLPPPTILVDFLPIDASEQERESWVFLWSGSKPLHNYVSDTLATISRLIG
ncbi:MAG: hypothetical protein ACK5N0_06085 [Synechococcaceae cyanobacterium]